MQKIFCNLLIVLSIGGSFCGTKLLKFILMTKGSWNSPKGSISWSLRKAPYLSSALLTGIHFFSLNFCLVSLSPLLPSYPGAEDPWPEPDLSVVLVQEHPPDYLCDLPKRNRPILTVCKRIPEGGHNGTFSLDEPPPHWKYDLQNNNIEEKSVGVSLGFSGPSEKQDLKTRISKGSFRNEKSFRLVVHFQTWKEDCCHPTLHKVHGRYSNHPNSPEQALKTLIRKCLVFVCSHSYHWLTVKRWILIVSVVSLSMRNVYKTMSKTSDAIGERAQEILVWVKAPGI